MVVLWKTGAGRMAVPSKKKKKKVATVDLGLPPPKTAKEMVLDALVEALVDRWHEDRGPYSDPEQYQNEFERFCEDQIYYAMKRGNKI